MIAVQLSPPSLSSYPGLPPPFLRPSMSAAPQTNKQHQNQQQPSVFQALGSYADRFKDANGSPQKGSIPIPESSQPISNNNVNVNGDSDASPPSSSATTQTPVMTKGQDTKSTPSVERNEEEDGQWQTVQSSRVRLTKEEKRGSNSKDWRDRSNRETPKEKNGDDTDRRKSNKKVANSNASSAGTSASTTNTAKPSSSRQPAAASKSTKPAWGIVPNAPRASQPTITAPESETIATSDAQQSQTVPSSPSINGTTLTNTSTSITASIGSPSLTAETSSTSTAPPSVLAKNLEALDGEGSWRARPTQDAEAKPPVTPKAAPPPAVNAWDLRKKQMTSTTTSTKSAAKPSGATSLSTPATANAQGQKLLANGHGPAPSKAGSKKKTSAQTTNTAPPPPPSHNTELWPDVAQAVEVVKSTEEKKERGKERRDSENTSVVDDATGAAKKPKWMPIPAAELQAAVDEAAEQTRRQSRMDASAKKRSASARGVEADSAAAPAKGGRAKKPTVTGADAKKGTTRAGPAGSAGEIRLPSQSQGQRDTSKTTLTPVFGSVQDSLNTIVVPASNGEAAYKEKVGATNPQSRRESQSIPTSPAKSHSQLPTPPISQGESQEVQSSSAPVSKPMSGSTTAPLPQHSFNSASNPNLPRVRNRDARGSFNGRGRGGFRSTSAFPYKGHGFASPPNGVTGLPAEGMAYVNGNSYQRGFQTFYPPTQYVQSGIYDPAQAQYANGAMYRATMPPPPMPQTSVSNIDALRFYVLGQVEYYFSMQNLAMDFFLRQQMDSEGWIDVAMIASFKRVKSLTPEVSIVRECMEMSNMLEVCEDRVRLAGGESQRWVLPGAKASTTTIQPEPNSPSSTSNTNINGEENKDVKDVSSHGIPASMDVSSFTTGNDNDESTVPSIQQTPPAHRALLSDVENALMKTNPTPTPASVPSSSTSVIGDEKEDKETVTSTTATSMSGETQSMGKEDEVELQ